MNLEPGALKARQTAAFPGVGTVVWDVETDRCNASDGVAALFGASEPLDSLGNMRAALQPGDRDTFDSQMRDARTSGTAAERVYRVVSEKTPERWLNIRAVGVQDGRRVEVLVCDVTRSYHSEINRHVPRGVHVPTGQVGVYTHDVAEGLSWWSSGMFKLFDMPRAPAISPFEEASKRIHPDDRARALAQVQSTLRSLGTFEMSYRVQRSDGTERMVLDCGEAVGPLDPATGLAREIRGSLVDITEHRVMVARAEQAQRAFDDLTEQMPFGMYLVDADLRITAVSQGARPAFAGVAPLVGRDLAEVLGKIWPEDFVDDAVSHFRQTLATGEAYHSPDATEYRKDWEALASYHWVVQRVATPEGDWGLVCHFYDLSERVNQQYDLEMDQAYKEKAIRELQAVIDNSVAFIGFLDPSGSIYEVNRPALVAGGLTRGDVIGRPFWETPWWSYDTKTAEKLKAAVSRAKRGEASRYDADVRMRDGFIMTIDFMLSPIVEASGNVSRIIASGFDITERKKAEDNVRMLMGEVNHRSKNVLMLVQSIARMTYRTEPDEFMTKLEERLGGLARSYDLLLTRDVAGIRLDDLVRAQLAHFGDLIDGRITLTGPDIRLTDETAQSLGMAFHELATNAGKYGALSTSKGRVAIAWSVTADGTAAPGFTLEWVERDGPEVTPPARTGFGSTVLGSMVENALDGTVQMDYEPNGLVWRVTSGRDCIEA